MHSWLPALRTGSTSARSATRTYRTMARRPQSLESILSLITLHIGAHRRGEHPWQRVGHFANTLR